MSSLSTLFSAEGLHSLSARRKSICDRELLFAAASGDVHEVQRLLKGGADVNFRDADGNTCLHWAALSRRIDVISKLLNTAGIDKIVGNCKNETALDFAYFAGKESGNEDPLTAIGKSIAADALQTALAVRALNSQSTPSNDSRKKTFFEATVLEDYQHPYSNTDVESIMKFLCTRLPENNVGQIIASYTFMLDHQEKKKTTLIRTKKNVYFHLNWNTEDQVLKGHVPTKTYGFDGADITRPLLKLKLAYDWLYNAKEKEWKKVSELERVIKRSDKTSDEDGRKLFANILNEVRRTESKIQACIQYLKKALEDQDSLEEFSFTSSNILIYFLETFALEDTYIEISMSRDEESSLARKKKDFWLRFFPTTNVNVRDVISKVRQELVHKTKRVIRTENIKTFITKYVAVSIVDFFEHLLRFCEQIMDNIDQCRSNMESDICVIFQKLNDNLSNLSFGRPDDCGTFETQLLGFCEKINRIPKEPGVVQELLFELIVNLSPNLDSKHLGNAKPQLLLLRNEVLHDFQKQSYEDLCPKLPSAVQDMYMLQLSLKIHKKLNEMRADSECSKLGSELDSALKSVNKMFTDFKLQVNKVCKQNKSEASRRIRYATPFITPSDKHVVSIYVNYLASIFDSESTVNENDGILTSHPDLTTENKRDIFQLVQYLQNVPNKPDNFDTFEKVRQTLKKNLTDKLYLSAHVAEQRTAIIRKGINGENKQLQEEVVSILTSIYSLPTELKGYNRHLSRQDLAIYYDRYVENSENNYFPSKTTLNEYEKKVIRDRFQSFTSQADTREVQHGNERVTVKISSMIRNLLKIKNYMQRETQLMFDTVESAFADDAFLSYLLKHSLKKVRGVDNDRPEKSGEVESNSINNDEKLEYTDPFHIYKVLRDIQHLSYTAPYVSKLLTETNDLRVINDDALQDLVKRLLGDSETKHFEAVMGLRSARVVKALCKNLSMGGFDQRTLCLVVRALSASNCMNTFLAVFEADSINSVGEEVRAFIQAGHCVILEFIDNKQDLSDAENILKETGKLLDTLSWTKEEFRFLRAQQKLLKVRLLNKQGQLTCLPDHENCQHSKFKEALVELDELLNDFQSTAIVTEDAAQIYFLALARKSYTIYLQGRCKKNLSYLDKRIEVHEKLLEEIWRFISCQGTPRPDSEQFCRQAAESSKFQSILRKGKECNSFLSVPTLFRDLYRSEFNKAVMTWQQDSSECRRLLENLPRKYDELYKFWETTRDASFKVNIMALLLYDKVKVFDFLRIKEQNEYYEIKVMELRLSGLLTAKRAFGDQSEWASSFCKGLLKHLSRRENPPKQKIKWR